MKKIFLILLLPIVILGGQLLYLYKHKEFKPDEFSSHLVLENHVFVPLLSAEEKKEIQHILSQPFTHLGLGKQMTAYESEDKQYVLKLFNPRARLKDKSFQDIKHMKSLCTMKWFSSAYFKRKERLLKIFNRHAIAFSKMKEEAGLLYVHLNPFTALDQTAHIIDKDGTQFDVHLKNVPFVLQRKVELAGARLAREQNPEACYAQLRELFTIRAKLGFTDRIQTLHNNYGFYGDKAIQIDVGRINFSQDVLNNPELEVDRIMTSINRQLSSRR